MNCGDLNLASNKRWTKSIKCVKICLPHIDIIFVELILKLAFFEVRFCDITLNLTVKISKS